MKRLAVAVTAVLILLGRSARAEDTLAKWAGSFETPETQYKIIGRIFSGLDAPSAGKLDTASGMMFFRKGSSWVRLGKDFAWDPYVAVSCMLYNNSTAKPVNATSYILRNTTDKAVAVSGGYSSHERAQKIALPKLGKSFLLITSYSGEWGTQAQWGAFLLEVGTDRNPRTVWKNPPALRNFQFGFHPLDGAVEKLVLRSGSGDNIDYSAYQWTGSRFEPDSFTFESKIQALPDDVFSYGATP